jgi:hypothetical protein
MFRDINEFADILASKITKCAKNFEILQVLEKTGIIYNKKPLFNLAKYILINRNNSYKNINAFIMVLNDEFVLQELKSIYCKEYRECVINLVKDADYQLLEERNFQNFRNLITLDEFLTDELAIIYTKKILYRRISHKKSNVDKLVRFVKEFPQISKKKILITLSSVRKMTDAKFFIQEFDELKNLSAFI